MKPGKFRYAPPLAKRRVSETTPRAHSTFASSSAGSSQLASMPSRIGALLSPKALSKAPTRPMAPPWYQTSIVEWSEGAASAWAIRRSISSSPIPATF
jgi:hypothetical protein